MINNNITLSKIVANSTDHAWAQAYSTLNLYIVLSLSQDTVGEQTVMAHGKELLERLQREFFALDQKDLMSIKAAVKNATDTMDKSLDYTITLATITENKFYIVTANGGVVVLKRDKDIGVVGEGLPDEITSYSGIIENHDTILIATASFFKKVPLSHLSSVLHGDVATIAENITPIIQGSSTGTEAAVIVSFQHSAHASARHTEETEEEEAVMASPAPEIPEENSSLKKFSRPKLPHVPIKSILMYPLKHRVGLIALAIGVLVIVLALSIMLQKKHAKSVALDTSLTPILATAQKNYDDAMALASLNKALANDELMQAKQSLIARQNEFPKGSVQRQKLDDEIKKIDTTLGGGGAQNSLKNQTVLYDAANSKEIKDIGGVAARGGLAIFDAKSGAIAILASSGSVTSTITSDIKNPRFITTDDKTIFLLGDNGIYKATRTDKKATSGADATSSDSVGMDTFGGNVYVLNKTTKSIDKYVGGTSSKSSYLIGGVTLAHIPQSLSIDSSIWVAEEGGTIERFTRGKADPISIHGIPSALGSHLSIYTDTDYANIYILDPKNFRIVEISKSGSYSAQYSSKLLAGATSFAVDEVGKKIYIVAANKLYSFDY